MKFLIDNNLSFKLVSPLSVFFKETSHVRDTVGTLADDITIWNWAKQGGFTILTKDNDFDERSQIEGCPPKIIHLICGNKTTSEILQLLLANKLELLEFGEPNKETCLLKLGQN